MWMVCYSQWCGCTALYRCWINVSVPHSKDTDSGVCLQGVWMLSVRSIFPVVSSVVSLNSLVPSAPPRHFPPSLMYLMLSWAVLFTM